MLVNYPPGDSNSVRICNAAREFYNAWNKVIKFPLRYEQAEEHTVTIFDDDCINWFKLQSTNDSINHAIAKQFCDLVNSIAKEYE